MSPSVPGSGGVPRAASELTTPTAGALIGRDADLRTVEAWLAAGERLVTVTGPAGIGKTRLAHECAARFVCAGGTAFVCELAEARDVADISRAVADALGVRPGAPADEPAAPTTIGRALAARGRVLVVLDTFEHLVSVAPVTVRAWLGVAPGAQFVVTSRERLRVAGERVLALAPLDTTPAGADAPPESAPAVQLLADRLGALRGADVRDATELRALGELAAQLEGIPLALELAASRVAVLGVPAVLAQLPRRLDLLAHGPRDAPARHASVRAALDWSWARLDAREQAVLAQCAVFQGGFTLPALEAVLEPHAATPLFDTVQSLCEKSLVRTIALPGGGSRFALYRDVASYAAEKLAAAGLAPAVFARWAAWCAEEATRARLALEGAEGVAALAALRAERENLFAAVRWALAAPPVTAERASVALRALVALEHVVWHDGPAGPFLELVDAALAAAPAELDPALRAAALNTRANRLRAAGRVDESRAEHERALALARQAGDRGLEGRTLRNLGLAEAFAGRGGEAARWFERAATLFREIGARASEAITLTDLGALACDAGRAERGAVCLERALELYQSLGHARRLPTVFVSLAGACLVLGRFDDARRYLDRALPLCREHGSAAVEALLRLTVAQLHLLEGRPADAVAELELGLGLSRGVGSRRLEGELAGFRGVADLEAGRLDEALERLAFARAATEAAGDVPGAAFFSALWAAGQADRGMVTAAQEALDAAEARAGATPEADARYGGAVRLLRAHVALARARAAAAARDLDAASAHRRAAFERLDETRAAAGAVAIEMRLAQRSVARALGMTEAPQRQPVARPSEAPPPLPRASDAPPPPPPAPSSAAPRELVVHRDGLWFELEPGRRVNCRRRGAVRLLLVALVWQRMSAPGAALSRPKMLEAGWPGERIMPEAADARLRVALSTLRTLGLRELLLRSDEGYLLDPAVPVRIAG